MSVNTLQSQAKSSTHWCSNALLCIFHSCLRMTAWYWANLSPLRCLSGMETSVECKITTWKHTVFLAFLIWNHLFFCVCVCVVVHQWWKPFHITAESGPEKRSHSAGVGCHRAQDPGSFPASSCTHQCYRGPCVCKSFVLFFPSPLFLIITPKKVVFNVIIGKMADEVRGKAAASMNHP